MSSDLSLPLCYVQSNACSFLSHEGSKTRSKATYYMLRWYLAVLSVRYSQNTLQCHTTGTHNC